MGLLFLLSELIKYARRGQDKNVRLENGKGTRNHGLRTLAMIIWSCEKRTQKKNMRRYNNKVAAVEEKWVFPDRRSVGWSGVSRGGFYRVGAGNMATIFKHWSRMRVCVRGRKREGARVRGRGTMFLCCCWCRCTGRKFVKCSDHFWMRNWLSIYCFEYIIFFNFLKYSLS